jgi:hypothetical protein
MMRPAQRPFFETGAVCVSDGMNFPPYVVRTKNQQMVEIFSREARKSSAVAD